MENKEWNTICRNTDGPREYHIKWIKSEKERQTPCDIAYVWNLKYDRNEQKQTHRHREQTHGCQEGSVRGGWIGSLGLTDVNYYI